MLKMPTKKKGPKRIALNRVRELRRNLAWPKARLAREAGIALGTLERMEAGLPTREDRRLIVARVLQQPYESVFPND